jgi:TetR/AcrR family transcriptional repressor of nem operon
MARPREFDLDDVIDQAISVFWANGFHATSLDDLCDAMRLNRSSLYSTFGDKRTLFLRTMDRYGEREAARVRETLSRPVSVDRAVTQYFQEVVEQIASGSARNGCLTGNAAAEVGIHDREVGMSVRRNLDRLEGAFRHALAQAKARAEISEHADINALARFFVAGAQGLRLIGKTTSNREALEDIAEQIVRAIKCDN